VTDDFAGQPPFNRTDANLEGSFELLTFPDRHRVRVAAVGYRPATVDVGSVWFMWRPSGEERRDVELTPEP
jgi:hypothetical protein